MAYEKTIWKDRAVEKPRTFNVVNNPDGTITLIPAPGAVVEEGTPINSANMNKIEVTLEGHSSQMAESAQDLNAHKSDNVKHITAAERTNWNAANTHITDNVKHITSTERTNWNNKIDKPSSAVTNNIAIFNASRNIVDSGKKPSDFLQNTSDVFVSGYYTGTGATTRLISLGFTPKAVIIFRNKSGQYYNSNTDGFAVTNSPSLSDSGTEAISIVSNGFNVYYDNSDYNRPKTNENSIIHHYIAFK